MRARLLLIPPALVISAGAHAEIYLDLKQAQERLFPGATFTEDFRTLSDLQVRAILAEARATVWSRSVKVWRVSTGGWLFLDQVVGRDDWISYAVGVSEDGAVTGIEVLECLERWNQITHPEWRAQFKGKKRGALNVADIAMISGSTLSSIHIAEGVKRLLATFALVVDPAKG